MTGICPRAPSTRSSRSSVVVLQHDAEDRHEHQQQREHAEEGVVRDGRRQPAAAVLAEALEHGERQRRGRGGAAGSVEAVEHPASRALTAGSRIATGVPPAGRAEPWRRRRRPSLTVSSGQGHDVTRPTSRSAPSSRTVAVLADARLDVGPQTRSPCAMPSSTTSRPRRPVGRRRRHGARDQRARDQRDRPPRRHGGRWSTSTSTCRRVVLSVANVGPAGDPPVDEWQPAAGRPVRSGPRHRAAAVRRRGRRTAGERAVVTCRRQLPDGGAMP